jgi:endonuclease G
MKSFLYFFRREMDGKLYVKYEVIGKNNVAVPTHFFKVLLIENNSGQYELLSFVLPNQTLPGNVKLMNYLVPLDSIERAAGLLIFDKMPRNSIKMINGKTV